MRKGKNSVLSGEQGPVTGEYVAADSGELCQQLRTFQRGHQQRQRLTLSAGEGAHLGGQAILQTQTQLPQPVQMPFSPATTGVLAFRTMLPMVSVQEAAVLSVGM